VIQAFTTGDKDRAADPIRYYEILAHPLEAAKLVIYTLQTVLGDAVLLWRCYIVWNKTLFVLIPGVIIILANFALGIVVSWAVNAAVPGKDIFNTAVQYITAFFATTLCVNMSCSAAIAFKIWLSRRSAPITSGISLVPIIAVIIESGAIYSTSILSTLIAYLSGSNGQYAALDLVTPLVGVVYCLIVLQIHFHLRVSRVLRKGATSNWSIPQAWRRNVAQTESIVLRSDVNIKPYPLQDIVAVHVTEHVEAHSDFQSQSKAQLGDVI